MKFSSLTRLSFVTTFLVVMSPMAVSQTTANASVHAGNIYDACKAVLVKKYIDEKVSDAEAAHFAAHHTCTYFAQKCKTEPEGEICKKALRDVTGN